jgi:hypothetical protein
VRIRARGENWEGNERLQNENVTSSETRNAEGGCRDDAAKMELGLPTKKQSTCVHMRVETDGNRDLEDGVREQVTVRAEGGISIRVQGVYNKTPSLWKCFKNMQMVFFRVISSVMQELKFQPKFIGHLTGHR